MSLPKTHSLHLHHPSILSSISQPLTQSLHFHPSFYPSVLSSISHIHPFILTFNHQSFIHSLHLHTSFPHLIHQPTKNPLPKSSSILPFFHTLIHQPIINLLIRSSSILGWSSIHQPTTYPPSTSSCILLAFHAFTHFPIVHNSLHLHPSLYPLIHQAFTYSLTIPSSILPSSYSSANQNPTHYLCTNPSILSIHQLIFIHSLYFIPSFHPLIDEPIIHQLTTSPFILLTFHLLIH